jgi:hypothetical protein
MLGDPARGGELEDEGAVHLLVEVEVERVQALVAVAEAGLLEAPGEEAILPADEFVLYEAGEEIDRGQLLGLRFEEPSFETRTHAGAPELAQGALQFDHVHEGPS